MNRRFAKWYYVIPGDDYDKLALSRTGLIKAKEQPEVEATDEITKIDSKPASIENEASLPATDENLEADDSTESSSAEVDES